MKIFLTVLLLYASNISLHCQVELKSAPNGPAYSSPRYLTAFKNLIFFNANSSMGSEPWVTDGTQNGTFMLADLSIGKSGSNPGRFVELNGKYFFVANDTVKTNVYVTDGTSAGTFVFLNFHDTIHQRYLYNSIIKHKDKLYFNALRDSNGTQLWETDGTEMNTKCITNFKGGSWNYFLGKINDEYVFLHEDSSTGVEIWKSKGSEYSATLIKDINPGKSSTQINTLGQINNSILFTALDSNNDRELWITDATANGTYLFKNINIYGASAINSPSIINNELLFLAFNDTNFAIWKSDGTAQGTHPYIHSRINEYISSYHVSGSDIFASVSSSLGQELYIKNGDSLVFFRDLLPGSNPSFPINFTNFNDSLVALSASTSNNTQNIWIINKNTKSVQMPFLMNTDLYSGSGFVNFKDKLFFGMYNFNFNGSSIYYFSPSNTSIGTLDVSPILISPNPCKTYIKIQHNQSISNVSIYNEIGRQVATQDLDKKHSIELDVNFLPSGVYLLNIIDVHGDIFWERLIKN